ncbi:MAG: DUF5714 domain-containing protein [Clostridiales bacterium]
MAVITPDMYEPYYDKVSEACLQAFSGDRTVEPFGLMTRLMSLEGLPMHCPVHHYIIPAALLAACRRLQGLDETVLRRDLQETEKRARHILPGFCGFYGSCGAAVGAGIFFSVITDTTPYSRGQTWGWANRATGQALIDIASLGGPRCCKRTCFRALQSVLPQIKETLGFDFPLPENIRCTQNANNSECLLSACPYYQKDSIEKEVAS